MEKDILELYPNPGQRHALDRLYLQQISRLKTNSDQPFIYSNYITSLDGRIALPGAGRTTHQVPPAIANPRDWQLFQELAAQADLLITTARFFRQTAAKEAQAELPVGNVATFDYLRAWRIEQGLTPQPDIAIFSTSLDIPPDALIPYRERKLLLITGANADPQKLARLSAAADLKIIQCGDGRSVDATTLRKQLGTLGYKKVYAIAGPEVLHALLQGDALDCLFLTTAHRLLGGVKFDTIVTGEELSPAFSMTLQAMYLDTSASEGASQTMAIYKK